MLIRLCWGIKEDQFCFELKKILKLIFEIEQDYLSDLGRSSNEDCSNAQDRSSEPYHSSAWGAQAMGELARAIMLILPSFSQNFN